MNQNSINVLESMREFASEEDIIKGVSAGDIIYRVYTSRLKPSHLSGQIEFIALEEWNGAKFIQGNINGKTTKAFSIADCQNHPAKALFTSLKRAEEFLAEAKRLFAQDQSWQAEHLEWLAEGG